MARAGTRRMYFHGIKSICPPKSIPNTTDTKYAALFRPIKMPLSFLGRYFTRITSTTEACTAMV